MKHIYCFRSVQIIVVTGVFLLGTLQKSMSQCTSALPGMTVNGVAITGQGTYRIQGGTETACTYTTPDNSLKNTYAVDYPDYTLNFSKPVNELRFVLTGSFGRFDYWRLEFSTNNGAPTIDVTGSCNNLVVQNSALYSNYPYTSAPGGGEFIVSVPGGFTSLSFRSVGYVGERIALCAESIIPCPDIPTLSTVTQPTCDNLTGSFRITNFNAANTYAVSPSENTSISSEGVVTAPLGASYTVTAANATCTSNPSTAAVVNNLICAQADVYTVEVDQTLTENLRANDGYIPPGETFFIPQPDPAFTNPSACVPLVVNNSSGEKTLTFTCSTVGVYHFLVPVRAGGTTVQVPLMITVNAALPVTLISFNAKQEGQLVNLEWETTEETNSDRFEIEWKTKGAWSKVGSVPAANESNGLIKYTFQHSQPAAGQNLYRLKMIDREVSGQDNAFAYSTIRHVDFKGHENNAVYPNPVTNGKLYLADWTNVKKVEIYNQQGKKLKTVSSLDTEYLDVSGLPNGLYVIKGMRLNGISISRTVAVNN